MAAPRITGKNTSSTTTNTGIWRVEVRAVTTAITRKNTRAPTRSSMAAMGIRVLVTGPEVLISFTMDREGAGAVARAIPPNRKAR